MATVTFVSAGQLLKTVLASPENLFYSVFFGDCRLYSERDSIEQFGASDFSGTAKSADVFCRADLRNSVRLSLSPEALVML